MLHPACVPHPKRRAHHRGAHARRSFAVRFLEEEEVGKEGEGGGCMQGEVKGEGDAR